MNFKINRKWKVALLGLLTPLIVLSQTTTNNYLWSDLRAAFHRGLPYLEEIQNVRDRITLGGYSLSLFQNKQSLRAELDNILLDSAKMLGGSELASAKKKVDEFRSQISLLRNEQTRMNLLLPAAPETRSFWQIGVWTRSEIEQRVQSLSQRMEAKDSEIQTQKLFMKTLLSQIFPHNSESQIEAQLNALLFTVTGENDILLISAFTNLRNLTVDLERYISNPEANDESRKIYFGQYTLLVRALISFHNEHLKKIERWSSRLSALETSARRAISQAESLKSRLSSAATSGNERSRVQLEANIGMNQRVLKVLENYKNYLAENKERVRKSLEPLNLIYEVAENTYHTMGNILNVSDIMNQMRTFSQAQMLLDLPELALVLDSQSLQDLESINLRLLQ